MKNFKQVLNAVVLFSIGYLYRSNREHTVYRSFASDLIRLHDSGRIKFFDAHTGKELTTVEFAKSFMKRG